MKTKFFTMVVLAAFTFSIQHANAKIRRVGYPGTAVANTDYYSLQTAHDAANSGDTMLIYPGSWSANFSKRLIAIGYGYFLSGSGADSGLQVITGYQSVGINLYAKSDSSVFEGLDNLGINIRDNISSIEILSCNCNIGGFGSNFINWKVRKSYVKIYANYNPTLQNVLFENNIFANADFWGGNGQASGIFNNNIFLNTPNFRNGAYSLYNNIFLSATTPANLTNSIFDYNIASNNSIPNNAPYNHNKPNVTLSTVFVGYPTQGTYSNDSRFMLSTSSPAAGAGQGGVDCGIFGGSNLYHLGGIPPIPSFYKLTAPTNTATTNPYTITFSVRSNN